MSETKTQSVINRSAVKEYALKVSAERRAGKFTRVSEDFLVNIEAEVESVVRQISTAYLEAVATDGLQFVTGAAVEKIRERLNDRARAIIQGKVSRHPSIGCTLKD